MKRITNNLLRLALSAGLTQRELFVERVSALLTEKMNSDPDMSTHIAQGMMNLTQTLKDELVLREIIAQMTDSLRPETEDKTEPGTGDGAHAGANTGAHADTESLLAEKMETLNRTITELNELLKTK